MQNYLKILAACTTLLGCAVTTDTIKNVPSYELWRAHSTTPSDLELAMIEAELGVRGETTNGIAYLGKRTGANVGKSIYARSGATSVRSVDFKNCSDFPSAATAQMFFLSQGGPVSDSHNLDADGDGLACEWGVELHKSVTIAQRPKSTPRYSYTPTCYTGPRGGRYTITSSGRKNYGGC